MKKGIVLLIFLLLGIALFVFTLKQVGLDGILESLALLSWWEMLIVFILLFISLVVVGGWKWKVILGRKDKGLFWTLFIGKWVGFSLSHVTPAALLGGEPARFLIVKNETNIESSEIVSSIILEKLSTFLIFMIMFFIGAFFILFYIDMAWLSQLIGIVIVVAVALLAWRIVRKIKHISHNEGFFKYIIHKLRLDRIKMIKDNVVRMDEVEEQVRVFLKKHKDRLFKLILITLFELVITFFAYWLIMYYSGVNMSIGKLIAIRTTIDASYNLTPIPAGLGVLEILQAHVFGAIGLTLANGVAFSLIFRGANLLISLIGIAIFAWMQLKYWGKQVLDKIEEFIIKYTNGKNNH